MADRLKRVRTNGVVPIGLKAKYNTFREMVLDWADNPDKFKAWADENPGDAYKLAGNLMPKEVDLGNKKGEVLKVVWEQS
jgi:hypothetical protein